MAWHGRRESSFGHETNQRTILAALRPARAGRMDAGRRIQKDELRTPQLGIAIAAVIEESQFVFEHMNELFVACKHNVHSFPPVLRQSLQFISHAVLPR